MKKLISTYYSSWAFNISMLILRITFGGILLFKHGLSKLQNFNTLQTTFYNFMGLGAKASLGLNIFAEVFCSLFVILGLFTRFTVVPIIITMLVVIFGAQSDKPFLESELAVVYLAAFLTLLFCGPGRFSVDRMIE
ncbi:MAG: DoxX family protein [Chitinophagaceae bacterium]